MQFRAGDVDCGPGDFIVVPRGVEHCPMALTDTCDVLLIERNTVLNTGSAAEDLGDTVHEKGTQSLTKRQLKHI